MLVFVLGLAALHVVHYNSSAPSQGLYNFQQRAPGRAGFDGLWLDVRSARSKALRPQLCNQRVASRVDPTLGRLSEQRRGKVVWEKLCVAFASHDEEQPAKLREARGVWRSGRHVR